MSGTHGNTTWLAVATPAPYTHIRRPNGGTTTVNAMGVVPDRLLAWLGPAIEQEAFEVGNEVREQFLARSADNELAFMLNARGRWQADLYDLARRELARLGVSRVFGGGFRCFADRDRFFSYRRDGTTGRMATLVWMK